MYSKLSLLFWMALAQDLGEWQNAGQSGCTCVHTILLPNYKLLCIERAHTALAAPFNTPYTYNRYTNAEVACEIDLVAKGKEGAWDAAFTPVPINTLPYCGGNAQMPDGRVLFIGGDGQTWQKPDGSVISGDGHAGRRYYTPCANSTAGCTTGNWTIEPDMATRRWYPTVVTLYDGRQLIVGGITGNIDMAKPEGNNPTYEYYPSNGEPRHLDLLEWAFPWSLYPTVMQMPSGNVFMFASKKAVALDPRTENVLNLPDHPAEDHMPFMYPNTPTFTVLPLTIKNNYTFTVQVCGGSIASVANTTKEASNQCWQISPDTSNPVWKRVDDMPHARIMVDSILLPDGKVLYVNGAGKGVAGGNPGECNYASDPVFAADLFDPEAPAGQQWKTLSSLKILRLYHSTAILVQSGHIVVAGSEQLNYYDYYGGENGNPDPECYPKGQKACTDPFNTMLERFTPPYLRFPDLPKIVNAPTELKYNTEFQITIDAKSTINRVVMLRYGSSTHQTNHDQRNLQLSMLERSSTSIKLRTPWNSAMAPPGNYMLFLVDERGAVSESATIQLQLDGTNFNFSPVDPNPPGMISARTSGSAKSVAAATTSILSFIGVISLFVL